MRRKKEKLLDKFVKKDYNNDLEEVLSKKIFQGEVKNLLLDILYKVEVSYKDYENVKKNVFSQEKYIENIINAIKYNCESINFLKTNDVKTRTFAVNKERKQILCYPISRKLLYCIAKIQKFDDIIKEEPKILNKTLTDVINIGNNINMVEPLRDFNGYSWNISVLDIENFYYNLIYQDLIFLIGNSILEEWTNKYDGMVDYMELFKLDLEKKYGKEISEQTIEYLKTISILLEMDTNKSFKKEIIERREFVETELKKMKNKEKYLDDLTKEKKNITKEIRDIDYILSDKNKLAKEYTARNADLPLEQKIFSRRILTKKLREEREEKISNLKSLTQKMNSKNFLKNENDLKYELKYLELANTEKIKKEILEEVIEFQKLVLQVFKIKIEKATNKEDIIKIIYELRYYNLIPLSNTKNIGTISKLKKQLSTIEEDAINKMYELKIINEICKEPNLNNKIIKNIFSTSIIRLEDIRIKVIKGKDEKYYLQFLDDDIEDSVFETNIKKEDLKAKLNKKIKLFI